METRQKNLMMSFLKNVVCVERPEHIHQYTGLWTTIENMIEIIKTRFNTTQLSAVTLQEWVEEDGNFGKETINKYNEGFTKCRYLYIKKKKYRGEEL